MTHEKSLGELLYETEMEVRGKRSNWSKMPTPHRSMWERVALTFKTRLEDSADLELVAVLRPRERT